MNLRSPADRNPRAGVGDPGSELGQFKSMELKKSCYIVLILMYRRKSGSEETKTIPARSKVAAPTRVVIVDTVFITGPP